MKSYFLGLIPSWIKRTDWDFYKNHPQFGTTKPDSYIAFDVDPGFPQFNQNAMALPMGCTGMAGEYVCRCEDGVVGDPKEIYDNTPPGTPGTGRNIRDALKRICTVGYRKYLTEDAPANPRGGYYNVRASGQLDWFDALYVSLLSTRQFKRPASIGIPWFSTFQNPDQLKRIYLPTVIPKELQANGFLGTLNFLFNQLFGTVGGTYAWHNPCVSGFAFIDGELHAKIYPWEGNDFGAVYLNRAETNKLFDLYMTEIFVVAQKVPGTPQTIDTEAVETIVALILKLVPHL